MIRITGLWKKIDKKGNLMLEGPLSEHFFEQLAKVKPGGKIYIFNQTESFGLNSPEYVMYVTENDDRP